MQNENSVSKMREIAARIKGMREVLSLSTSEMAEKAGVAAELYNAYENGEADLPFTFIHACAKVFGMELSELLEGRGPNLSSYAVTRRGEGEQTAKEAGIMIQHLAPKFRGKMAEPYWVRYEYSDSHR